MVLLQLQVIPLIKGKLSGKGQGRSTQACQLIKKQIGGKVTIGKRLREKLLQRNSCRLPLVTNQVRHSFLLALAHHVPRQFVD
jgi:hypothetical protein